jgi:hypothetical protein
MPLPRCWPPPVKALEFKLGRKRGIQGNAG